MNCACANVWGPLLRTHGEYRWRSLINAVSHGLLTKAKGVAIWFQGLSSEFNVTVGLTHLGSIHLLKSIWPAVKSFCICNKNNKLTRIQKMGQTRTDLFLSIMWKPVVKVILRRPRKDIFLGSYRAPPFSLQLTVWSHTHTTNARPAKSLLYRAQYRTEQNTSCLGCFLLFTINLPCVHL